LVPGDRLNSFTFHAYAPCPALAPFVEVIWAVRGAAAWSSEVVLPNGAIELIINFGPTQKVLGYGDIAANEDFRQAWLAGIQDQPLVIASPHGADHLGVRFRPGGAHAFFDIPMDLLRDRVLDLDLLLGSNATELRDRLGCFDNSRSRAIAVEHWLLARRYAVHPYFGTVRRAIDLIHESSFRTSVTDVCDRLGLSNRHLIDQFRRVVGLTPKTTSRVIRFNSVIRHVSGRREADWARIANRFGFADQSHLIREFRQFGGVTPEEFLARRTPGQAHLIRA